MIVALDGTPVVAAPYTGIARYTQELSAALRQLHPESTITLEVCPPNAGFLERRWWSIGLPRRLREIGATLFHGTDFAIPLTGRTPAVVTVHDLSPLRAREFEMPATAQRIARRLPGAIRRGRAILTPSQLVADEIAGRFQEARGKIFVTPLAPAAAFRPQTKPAMTSRPYILYVGAKGRRKNFARLMRAVEHLRKDCDLALGLVAVGGSGGIAVQSDQELAELYSGATAVVYPSLYEGFGLPVIEAMACGAPVITSRGTACAEVAGNAAILIDPENEQELAGAMRAVATESSLAASLREKGLARAQCFSWQRTAQLTWDAYESALSRS